MRLVDADKLILHLNDYALQESPSNVESVEDRKISREVYSAIRNCMKAVEEQPTAFDVDTLGIDTKKLDNADAQREKEKTTLYTRNAIVKALQETLPDVVAMCINADNIFLHKKGAEEVKVNVSFGEYANPSFESQVETIAKAKQGGIMSIERCVEELYGDTLDEHCKEEEITRLKAEQGIQDMEEPAVNMTAGDFYADLEGGEGDEGKSRTTNVQNEPQGVPGTTPSSKGAGADGNLRGGES